MNSLRKALEEYLTLRRSLGFGLRLTGGALHNFVSFLDQQGATRITRDLALEWAQLPTDAQPAQWANRLGMVRRFAAYRSAVDPRTEFPPQGLLPYCYRRKPPYIYRASEIRQLIHAAQQLPSSSGLRSSTYSTLFALIEATGMRISEPLALDRDDVDLAHGVITIRQTKFRKSRLVPVHISTQRALRDYAARRDRVLPTPKHPSFLLSERGTRLTECAARWTFVKLSRQIKLRGPSDSHGPRLHDLRHRFAILTLLSWHRAGIDVEQRIPELATYLGHTHVSDTYWYLSATPELMRWAALRADQSKGGPWS
jgi:integrase/recombinase XerD